MPHIVRKTITETFLERVAATPDLEAFQFKQVGVWKTLSFREFYNETREAAFGLMGLGVLPGDRVGVLSNTRYEWSLADMAILGSGAVTVPIYVSHLATDYVHILNHSEARAVIVENEKQLKLILDSRDQLQFLKKIIVFEAEAMRIASGHPDVLSLGALKEIGRREAARDPQRFDDLLKNAHPGDLLTICYTSGTTGLPKGVMLTHDNLMSVIEDCLSVMGKHIQPESETVLSFLPISHVIGKVESMFHYATGWKTCFVESLDKLMTNLVEAQPTLFFAVPYTFEKIRAQILTEVESMPALKKKSFEAAFSVGRAYYEAIWAGKSPSLLEQAEYMVAKKTIFDSIMKRFGGKVKFAVCSGAPLAKDVAEFFQMIGLNILEGYGLTETCAPVSLNTFETMKFGTVGRPLPEVSIKFLDDGEILVHSRKIFKGYFKDEEETHRVLNAGWLSTGDIGHMDEQGFLRITDRKKDLIITSGGKNIAPLKIETMAQNYKIFSHFIVYGDRRHFLTALVTLSREETLKFAEENQILFSTFSELTKHPKVVSRVQKSIDEMNAHLANFETIRKFIVLPQDFSIESGELTPSLKVKRNVVNQKFQTELDSLY